MERYLPRYFSGAASIYSRLPKSEFGQEFRRNGALVAVANASDEAAAASKETEASAADAPPAFTEHMTDVRCAEGEDITLECRVTPANDPRLQIGKDGCQMTTFTQSNCSTG